MEADGTKDALYRNQEAGHKDGDGKLDVSKMAPTRINVPVARHAHKLAHARPHARVVDAILSGLTLVPRLVVGDLADGHASNLGGLQDPKLNAADVLIASRREAVEDVGSRHYDKLRSHKFVRVRVWWVSIKLFSLPFSSFSFLSPSTVRRALTFFIFLFFLSL